MIRNPFHRREQAPGNPYLAEKERLLKSKVFIDPQEINGWPLDAATELQPRQSVGLYRIVSAGKFDDWAAEGSFKRSANGEVHSSLEYALRLANEGVAWRYDSTEDHIELQPFADANGSIWYSVAAGRHRILGAKATASDSATIEADISYPKNGVPMAQYDGIIFSPTDNLAQGDV